MRRSRRGFSLLEVIVAFAILALMIGPIMRTFSGGLALAGRTTDVTDAITLARSKMAEVGTLTPVAAEQRAGHFTNTKFYWHLAISPFGAVDDQGAALLYRVQVLVSWKDGRVDRSVELVTARVGETQ